MIDRDAIAGLDHMAFVREDFAPNSDYWQLVGHCRSGNDARAGTPGTGYYDVVCGRCPCIRNSWLSRTLTRSVFTLKVR